MTIEILRALSQIFSPPVFHKIVREDNFEVFQKKVEIYSSVQHEQTNHQLIKSIYKSLQKQYRCEYVYKNSLIVNLLKTQISSSSITLNELKIGKSKADLVILNGKIKVYEIKTELDSLDKLSKQITDYQKFADEVYVVTDEKYANRLECEYKNSSVGIIIFNHKNNLDTLKKATSNEALFDFETLFKTLRKKEYLDLVARNFNSIPNVPNTKIFKVCYELLAQVDLIEFQTQVLDVLKRRKLSNPDSLKSSKTPKELKHICNALDFNETEYQKLYHFLETKSRCINHILEESNLN